VNLPPVDLPAVLAADGEFALAARHWTGGLRLVCDGVTIGATLVDGSPVARIPAAHDPGVIELSAPADVWARMLEPVPPRFFNDVSAALTHGLRRRAEPLLWWQYVPAVQRAIELLRPPAPEPARPTPPTAGRAPGAVDAPIGRYLHIGVDGLDHRIYVEEAGRGIPLLLQHTAGSHSIQWRHLMERPEITDHFRLIAYDLPFHGKSLPPDDTPWWAQRYRLTGTVLRGTTLAIADALGLERPVFMGCSVGGLLALDLAYRHPARFRAVISLEGALHIGGDPDALLGFWHPAVSNETKARVMEGLMSPTAPLQLRKETSLVYSAGWPQAFTGDLHYYLVDYDLRGVAHLIDTDRVGVHLLSGEYDHSATVEMGRQAHDAIAGSTFTVMRGLGHFPMSEDPDRFLEHLLPVLDRIRSEAEGR